MNHYWDKYFALHIPSDRYKTEAIRLQDFQITSGAEWTTHC